jgi:hypothetical protein
MANASSLGRRCQDGVETRTLAEMKIPVKRRNENVRPKITDNFSCHGDGPEQTTYLN